MASPPRIRKERERRNEEQIKKSIYLHKYNIYIYKEREIHRER